MECPLRDPQVVASLDRFGEECCFARSAGLSGHAGACVWRTAGGRFYEGDCGSSGTQGGRGGSGKWKTKLTLRFSAHLLARTASHRGSAIRVTAHVPHCPLQEAEERVQVALQDGDSTLRHDARAPPALAAPGFTWVLVKDGDNAGACVWKLL